MNEFQRVILPDGREAEFPAGMSKDKIQRILQKKYPPQKRSVTALPKGDKTIRPEGDVAGAGAAEGEYVSPIGKQEVSAKKIDPKEWERQIVAERAQRERDAPGPLQRGVSAGGKFLTEDEKRGQISGMRGYDPISMAVSVLSSDPTRILRGPAAGIAGLIGLGAGAVQKAGVASETESRALERDVHGLLASSAGLPLRAAGPAVKAAQTTRPVGLGAAAKKMGVRLPVGGASGSKVGMGVQRGIDMMPGRRMLSRARNARNIRAIEKEAGRAADRLGGDLSGAGAGDLVSQGVGRHIEKFFNRGQAIESRLRVSPDTPVILSRTADAWNDIAAGKGAFADVIKGLAPERAIALKAKFDAVLEKGGAVTWSDVSALRRAIGQARGAGKIVEDVGRQNLKKLYASLSDDMRSALSPEKARSWDKLNAYWVKGFDRIESRLNAVDKAKSPDLIINKLTTEATRDPSSFRKVVAQLSVGDRRQLGAYFLRRMGDPHKGEAGATFNLNKYLTEWNKTAPAVKDVLFGKKSVTRTDLDRIAAVADRLKQFDPKMDNPSGTASVLGDRAVNYAGMASVAHAAYTGDIVPAAVFLGTVGLSQGLQGAARATSMVPAAAAKTLMGSQKFLHWLARAGEARSADAIPQYLGALGHAARTMTPAEQEAVQVFIAKVKEQISGVTQPVE